MYMCMLIDFISTIYIYKTNINKRSCSLAVALECYFLFDQQMTGFLNFALTIERPKSVRSALVIVRYCVFVFTQRTAFSKLILTTKACANLLSVQAVFHWYFIDECAWTCKLVPPLPKPPFVCVSIPWEHSFVFRTMTSRNKKTKESRYVSEAWTDR